MNEHGAVLFVALIVLVAMMLGSVVLVRAVDTTNVIAGNLTFRQSTVQAADYGIEAAVAALPGIVAGGADENVQADTYWYYATLRATDEHGVPTQTEAGGAPTLVPIAWERVQPFTTVEENTVRIVIERLCTGPGPVTDVEARCLFEGDTAGGSKAVGRPVFASKDTIYYRVTAHVTGPRHTVSLVQAVVSR